MSMNISGYGSANSNGYPQLQKQAGSMQKTSAHNSTATNKESYWEYLSENYDCVKNGQVSISPAYLRACADNPEKAKELEENLGSYNECYDMVLNSIKKEGDTVTAFDLRYEIDKNGEVTVKGSVTVVARAGGKSLEELKEELEEEAAEKEEKEKLETEKDLQRKVEKELLENTGKGGFNFKGSIDVQVVKTESSISEAPGATSHAVDTVA